MKKKILSYLLAFMLCLTVLPVDVFTQLTYASTTYGFGSTGNGSSESGSGSDVSFPSTPAVDGGNGYGTWITINGDDIFIKNTAKAKTSNYYYNTIGWTIHKKDSGDYNDPSIAEKIQYVPMYVSDNRASTDGKGNQPHTISGGSSQLYFYNHDGEGKVIEPVVENDKVTQLYKMNLTKFKSTLIDKGYTYMSLPLNTTHRFYLSGASRVTEDGSKTWRGPYTSESSFKSGAGSALWDVVKDSYNMYFDIPLDIKMEGYNTVSFYDITTGKRLQFNNAGSGDHKYTVRDSYTINGKNYNTIASVNYPWLSAPETATDAYMESTYISLVKSGAKSESFYNNAGVARARSFYSDKWTNDPGDSTYWSKVHTKGKETVWNNTSKSNLFGNSTIVFVMPESADVVGYDNTTGLAVVEGSSISGVFKFDEIISTDKGAYKLIQTSTKDNTNLDADKKQTETDVKSGKPVMGPSDNNVSANATVTVPQGGIGRAEYTPVAGVDVLYYDNSTGDLIYREKREPSASQTVQGSIDFDGDRYKTVEVSYKLGVDPEDDISSTKSPVMTSSDLNRTQGTKIVLNPGDREKQHIIRVSCEKDGKADGNKDGGVYTIPSQHLTYNFSYKFGEPLTSKVDESSVQLPRDYTHRVFSHYENDYFYDDNGNLDYTTVPVYVDCDVTYEINWGVNRYDWNDTVKEILDNSLVFAGKGTLTKINNNWHAEGNSFNINVNPSLSFTSHRKDVDGHVPTFAAYMETENARAKNFLKSNDMGSTVSTGLTPGSSYTNKGGDADATVKVSSGSHLSPHGREFVIIENHSHCGSNEHSKGVASPYEYSEEPYKGKVIAEPSIVAKPLPEASKVSEVVGNPTDGKVTIYKSPSSALKFYPTYKMYAGGLDAWLLGKEQRNFVPVDVFEVEVLNSNSPITVDSTWSRDAQDVNRLVMKGGYTYGVKSSEPLKIKVTSHIHVPKLNYVENASSIRSSRLQAHTNLVNSIADTTNYKLFSNLPEAFQTSYPAEWKIQNPYKTSSDNVAKSRMNNPVNIRSSISTGAQTVMSLSALDSKFLNKTQSASRLNGQLETNSWYVEKFDGFEVIKLESTISVSFGETLQTNFIRNGGANYNDLAKAVQNIPAKKFGITFGFKNSALPVNGGTVDLYMLSKPFLFDVRGTLYDDRN